MINYGIQDVLNELGIKGVNPGASDGINCLETKGDLLESYSPADGK